jgi:GTPase
MPIDSLLAALDRGDTAALARAISLVENQRDGFESLLGHMHARAGTARRVGITGPPGAGKSTLIERLVQAGRRAGRRVAVVAVDPTSPFTGGALLGDRIRMESVSTDPGVFIRSMATRGSVGGLATTTEEVADVLDGAGFDRIVIETVGIGQTELDVARTAQTTALVLVPESGDGIQTLKAGVMEVADVFVINKSDRPGADRLKAEVEAMLGLRAARPVWKPPVILTVATTGDGVTELAAALDAHHAFLERTGGLAEWRRRRLAERTRAIVNRALRQWLWEETRAEALLAERLDAVARGSRNPYEVAAEILDQLKTEVPR